MKESFEQGEIRNGRSLFFVAIAIVDTYERADEGEDFAEGNEDGGVDDADGREGESGGEQCAPEDAHCDCREELEKRVPFHGSSPLLSEGVEAFGPVHLLGALVETLPRLAEQPAFVGGVLECRAFGLALLDEVYLVIGQVHEVHRTLTRCLAHYFESFLSCFLLCTHRSSPVAVNGGVLEFGCTPVAEHRPMLFGDFATDVVNRVEKKYFSHKFIYN